MFFPQSTSIATNDSRQVQPQEAVSPTPSGAGQGWERPPLPLPHLCTLGSPRPRPPGLDRTVWGPLGTSPLLTRPCRPPPQGTRAVSTPSRTASPTATATGWPSRQPVGTNWLGRPTVSTPCGPMATTASVHLYLPQVSPTCVTPFPERPPRPNPIKLSALYLLSSSLGTAP